MIKTSDMGLFQFKEFEQFLPQPRMEGIEGETLGARATISVTAMDLLEMNHNLHINDMIAYHWEKLYEDVVRRIARASIGRKEYFVTRFVPRMRDEGAFGGIVMELLVDCMIAQTRNVIIPEFIYEPISSSGHTRLIEWRCGYCKSPNEMKERHCTQCGSPRALLIQEM